MPEEYKTRFYHYWHVVVWKGVGRKKVKIEREEEKEGEKEGERERKKKK